MPFYNIFADWPAPLDEVQQFVRLKVAIERVLGNDEHLIVGITNLSTTRGRLTFQTEEPVEASDFEEMVVVGAIRLLFSPIRLGDGGFPLLEVGTEAVEIGGRRK